MGLGDGKIKKTVLFSDDLGVESGHLRDKPNPNPTG
jgi:hypothetical protein